MFYWFDCIVLQEHFWDYLWELSETRIFKKSSHGSSVPVFGIF